MPQACCGVFSALFWSNAAPRSNGRAGPFKTDPEGVHQHEDTTMGYVILSMYIVSAIAGVVGIGKAELSQPAQS